MSYLLPSAPSPVSISTSPVSAPGGLRVKKLNLKGVLNKRDVIAQSTSMLNVNELLDKDMQQFTFRNRNNLSKEKELRSQDNSSSLPMLPKKPAFIRKAVNQVASSQNMPSYPSDKYSPFGVGNAL